MAMVGASSSSILSMASPSTHLNSKPIRPSSNLSVSPPWLRSPMSASLWFLLPRSSTQITRSRFCTSIRMMLPSQDPQRASSGNQPKMGRWSARAIKSYSMAELEARKLKYPNTGTETILMGLLTEGTSQAARYLRAHGITLFGVREESIKLLGKSDMYFFSPEHPPLTEPAQKALDWAVNEKQKTGADGEVTATHLLLGIWAQKGSAGQLILAALGFNDKNAEDLEGTLKQPALIG